MQNLYTLTHSINTNSFGINAEKQHSLNKSKQNITATTLHEEAAEEEEKSDNKFTATISNSNVFFFFTK